MRIILATNHTESYSVTRTIEQLANYNQTLSTPNEVYILTTDKYHFDKDIKATVVNIEIPEKMSFITKQKSKLTSCFSESYTPRFDYIANLCKEIKKIKPDRILLFDIADAGKDVYTASKIYPSVYVRRPFLDSKYPLPARYFKYIDKFIFNGQELLDKSVKLGVPKQQAVLIKDCADLSFGFNADRRKILRDELHIAENGLLCVYFGHLSRANATDDLVKAFVKSDCGDTKLLVIGKADDNEFFDEIKAEANDSVIFIDEQNKEKLNDYLSAADFAIEPRVSDSFSGMSVIEAMSVGLPQIISNGGALEYIDFESEYIIKVSRGLGYVNSLSMAIEQMCDNLHNGLCDEVRNEMIKHSVDFSSDNSIKKLFEIL